MARKAEHRLAGVQTGDRPGGADQWQEVTDVEAGPASHIEDALALTGRERLDRDPPTAQDVRVRYIASSCRAVASSNPSCSELARSAIAAV
jgi:hypothetical protein